MSKHAPRATNGPTSIGPRSRFVQQRFYLPALTASPQVKALVHRYWKKDIRAAEPYDPEKLIDKSIRNSALWKLRDASGADWLLREALRKAVTRSQVVRTKHQVLASLEELRFPSITPLVTATQKHCAQPTSRGPVYELYPFVADAWPYAEAMVKCCSREVASLPARLLHCGDILSQKEPELWSALESRYATEAHQFQGLDATVPRARELGARLAHRDHNGTISTVVHEIVACFGERSRGVFPSSRTALTHGDLTENNVLIKGQRAVLVDWDSVRVAPRGFDTAFALARLGSPRRGDPPLNFDAAQIDAAGQFLLEFNVAYAQLAYNDSTPSQLHAVTKDELRLGLRSVKYEFSLRMMEYFEFLSTVEKQPVDYAYLRRCNPGNLARLEDNIQNIWADASCGSRHPLADDLIEQIYDASRCAGLCSQRPALLSGIEPRVVANLTIDDKPSAQLLLDLRRLNVYESNGSTSLRKWLRNAQLLVQQHESPIFGQALEKLGGAS